MNTPTIRTIFEVDVDCFLASVEQIVHPKWRGQPVCVGGTADDRSVVASASLEAKRLGIRTAMTIAQARRLCPSAIFTRGSFPRYEAASRAILAVIADFSPDYEVASLDDVYVDLSGFERLYGPAIDTAERLKRRIREATGLDVTIGIGANKLAAKMACAFAKPNGIAQVRPGCERAFIAPMAVPRLPGVGAKIAQALDKYNIQTIGELAQIPLPIMEATFGAHGRLLARRARGIDDDRVKERDMPNSISRETSFEQDTADRGIVEAMAYYLIERACRKLRSLGAAAKTLRVKVRYADFDTRAASQSLDQPSDQDRDFYRAALGLMGKLLTRRMRIRLVGIALSNLRAGRVHQPDLFAERDFAKMRRLYSSIDAIRNRYGFNAITAGPSIALLGKLDQDAHGFKLRTSCLTQ